MARIVFGSNPTQPNSEAGRDPLIEITRKGAYNGGPYDVENAAQAGAMFTAWVEQCKTEGGPPAAMFMLLVGGGRKPPGFDKQPGVRKAVFINQSEA